MILGTRQEGIDISGHNGKVVAGDDNSTSYHQYSSKTSKLSKLFERLNKEYNANNEISDINDDLQRYLDKRDTIGLEQKLINGNREYLFDDASWLKQEYAKKLTKFQFFEPAQEIHALLLGIILEKFRNRIYPLIREKSSDIEILKVISEDIVNPILNVLQEEGCDDVMGLDSTDIEGMIYFLTGRCHIKWNS
ncbi:hypothetical protein Q765_19900 [Flavobacterium rivuli WB 3.3-2 = DSM 21788]|uniref:ABC-three component systems C-terminal domain-containing protein n=1 Tax=Flavobacterium rivuli WB 3.3-2 = DSM 21788 TaxID=1121895 RepID=A0A0A2LXR1_9FLAO|nr:ABC-three component system protein [Flavobacterium rivuli]KGO84774.1 hypothetical protein Q765_19900 [Flavobacterium rivuli WB 3.3-2 = DSM 21788]